MEEPLNPLVLAGTIAAIIAAVIGIVSLARNIWKDRSEIRFKISDKVVKQSPSKKYFLVRVLVIDNTGRLPQFDIGPLVEFPDGRGFELNKIAGIKMSNPNRNSTVYEFRGYAFSRELNERTITGYIWARKTNGVWYSGKIPRKIMKHLRS